jgi:iron complex outermembrane receptor protein
LAITGSRKGRTGARRSASRHLITGIALCCTLATEAIAIDSSPDDPNRGDQPAASGPANFEFVIDAPLLSQALIQFSQQSDQAIVFSDRLTRNIIAPPYIGRGSISEVLDALLHRSDLSWKLVDGHIIVVLETRCLTASGDGANCVNPEQVLSKFPVYDPGLEETYVYGNRVTGSRIRHRKYGQASPVDIISAPDIELSGAQTIGELLKFVPAVSGNSTSTAISNGGDGTATVTLRGLPSSNTLVLINGKRVAYDGLAGESVDLNSIPPAAVERIEILKGGASAIYGSDAIAGVVNVIMKQDFHGFLAETYYGKASADDLKTQTHTLQYGTGIPNGSFFLSASIYDQEPIFSADRRVSSSADSRQQGGADLRSSATASSRITLPGGETVILDEGAYRSATDEDLFDFSAFTTAIVPLERTSLYSNISYDFNELVTGLVEFQYLETDAKSMLAPTPIFTAFEQTPLTISKSNVYNPFGVDIVDARRRLLEFPARRQQDKSEVSRFGAVLEGLYDTWNWDMSYNWSRSEASQSTTNLVNANNLQRGLGPSEDCQSAAIDGCVPINLFGPVGSISPEQVDFLVVPGEVSGYYKLSSYSASISNELLALPHGKGAFALGTEYRRESTSKKPSDIIASIGTIGGTNFEATRGDRQILEVFVEATLPVWESHSGLYGLDLEVALRHSSYSDFGDTTNPQLGLLFQFSPNLLFRMSYAEGFRAPSLNELYQGNSEEQAFLNDPCTQQANVGVLPGCHQQADPTRNQFLVVVGGNSELEPETSESYGAGLVWTPLALPGFSATLDYFKIDQGNVVDSSAQFIVGQNARNGAFGEQVERDAMGNLQLIRAINLNVGRRKVSGADLSLIYHHRKRPWGQLSVTASGTYIDQYRAKLDASSEQLDLAGSFRDEASEGLGGIPEWKAQLGVQLAGDRWVGSYEMHHISSLTEIIPGTMESREIASWTVHDLQMSYTFDLLGGLRWAVGVDNLLDETAPLAASAFNDNIDGRTHELKGQYWYTKLSQRF